MPNAPARPAPVQLPLFAEAASLVRIAPENNLWRLYRMEVWPDLFGRALLMRQWGRIGTEGHRRLDPYSDLGAALNALPSSHEENAVAAIKTVLDDTATCGRG